MSSVCISSCVQDARVPVRATYVNLYKWPESDAEFMKSVHRRAGVQGQARVVDSLSCRQMYLRSYTFSREEEEEEPERRSGKWCFGGVKGKKDEARLKRRKKKKCVGGLRKVKEVSCAALFRFFHSLLACTTSVQVVGVQD